ncbi:hypothetical protein PF005_g23593 [Phytophthora fragariae]|uniref:Uncharacterized protein n=1 Tax=Phytophthora fragariae TaxID=53985 RepID=A0A6A3WC90_9STRA|nr:hypothetical protein PF003_g18776 [Phytophthora fragariae]KAE8932311.1 hypothetical protein PF009_g17653 [Phytophthora fragariae]KAE9102567.1 hypothetical protein PF006_g22392 [Phytophthora fragariae]KAE9179697.1 hypothetical protein PF005_g23593 [Phytophthora fragariae]KAE9190751.1 hypothetical protein PF002_g24685 [Phytophthora fragariae]
MSTAAQTIPTDCHRTFGGTNHSLPAQILAFTMWTDAKARSTGPTGSRRAELESLLTTCTVDRAAALESVLSLSITCVEDTSALESSLILRRASRGLPLAL